MKYFIWFLGMMLLSASCATTAPKVSESVKPEIAVTNNNEIPFDTYSNETRTLFYKEYKLEGTKLGRTNFHLPSLTYEALNLAMRFDLISRFSAAEFAYFAYALLEKLDVVDRNGIGLRDIIVPGYFDNGSPLVIHVALLALNDSLKIVWISNAPEARGDVEQYNYRRTVPLVETPRFEHVNPGRTGGNVENGIIHLYRGGFLTSQSVNLQLDDHASASDMDVAYRVADAYIRDGNRENDSWIPARLQTISRDEDQDPTVRCMAYLNLVQHYYYLEDNDNLSSSINELVSSGILKHEKVIGTVLEKIGTIFTPYLFNAYMRISDARQQLEGSL